MRLDSACIVAPAPKVDVAPTRRGFLFTAGVFVAGASFGGACGYAAGVSASGEASSGGGSAEPQLDLAAGLKPTGDADLDTLRRWALQEPIDELEKNIPIFIEQVQSVYLEDTWLWHGMGRLAQRAVSGHHVKWPRATKQALIQAIEDMDLKRAPANALLLRQRLPDLKRLR